MTGATRVVVAQGTFDLIHPGHVHYLEESAALGDRLEVIVSRAANVDHKEPPILPASQRRDVVGAIGVVDRARVGHPSDIFVPIEEIRPDVITLGFDQHHDIGAIEAALEARDIACEVVRIGPRPETDEGLHSTSAIVDRILERYG